MYREPTRAGASAKPERAEASSRREERSIASPAEKLGRWQSQLGNRHVARMLAAQRRPSVPIQRMMEPNQEDVGPPKTEGESVTTAPPPTRETYERALRSAHDGPAKYQQLLVEAQSNPTALQALNEADAAIQAEVNGLRNDVGVLYGNPPLDEQAGLSIFSRIEKNDTNVFQGLLRQGAPYQEVNPRKHEWGLGRARTSTGEVFLLIGERDGVSWSAYLDFLAPLAHSHPYFDGKPPRRSNGNLNLETKEIADHASSNHIGGIVRWDDLIGRTNADMTGEVSKIFPSASDIAFCAKKNVPRHEVYTPYAVISHPAMGVVIANPEVNGGAFRQAPRLRFVISDAKATDDSGEHYSCTLTAHIANRQWQATVRTEGAGQMGVLDW